MVALCVKVAFRFSEVVGRGVCFFRRFFGSCWACGGWFVFFLLLFSFFVGCFVGCCFL